MSEIPQGRQLTSAAVWPKLEQCIQRHGFTCPVSENAHINNKGSRDKLRVIPLGNNEYKTEDIKAFGKIGFGVNTVDLLDYAANRNGVNLIEQ